MTKDVLPESRNKSYARQQEMITELAQKNIGYEVPETLEAVACIFAQYFGSNIRLFNELSSYTRCKEGLLYQIIVGGFDWRASTSATTSAMTAPAMALRLCGSSFRSLALGHLVFEKGHCFFWYLVFGFKQALEYENGMSFI